MSAREVALAGVAVVAVAIAGVLALKGSDDTSEPRPTAAQTSDARAIYAEGEQAGRREGEDIGLEAGRGEGRRAGEQAGRREGEQAGVAVGRREGERTGRREGQHAGEQAGRLQGEHAGEQAGRREGERVGFQRGTTVGEARGELTGAEAALGGFSQWTPGAYYVVTVTRGGDGVPYRIATRSPLRPATNYRLCERERGRLCALPVVVASGG